MKIFASNGWPFLSFVGTCTFCTNTSLPRETPSGTTSSVTPCDFALATAAIASPMFSLPSDMITNRFWPVSANAAVPSRIAEARSERCVSTTASTFSRLIASFGIRSMLASVPKMMTPALSTDFFCSAILLTRDFAASCCAEGTLSERSNTKKTFIPSTGSNHCKPAMASTRARQTTTRNARAVRRRHGAICTSVFHASHAIHASAGSASSR